MRIELPPLVFALAVLATPCYSQERPHDSKFYVAPLVTFVKSDSDRAMDDDAAFGIAAGFAAPRNWNLELNLFRGRFDGANGDDLTLDAVGVNALRPFRRDARLTPYVSIGLGTQRNDRALAGSSSDAYTDAGGGLLKTMSRSESRALLLRLDARARYADTDDGGRLDFFFGVGLQYAFGSARSERAPAGAPPTVVSPPADADRDGVPDSGDRCPGTEHGRAVRADGCEIDADRDGVADDADACPRTALEAPVDSRGCELAEDVVRVTFAFDSNRLGPDAMAALDRAVEILRRAPSVRIEVAGHTDDRGPEAYNLALSQRRADAVRRHLVERGVTNVLTARGYGETAPIGDNGIETGRAENRRVVLRVVSR